MKKFLILTIATVLVLSLSCNVFAATYSPTVIYKDSTCPTSDITVDQDGIEYKVVAKGTTYNGVQGDVLLKNAYVATYSTCGAYVWFGNQGKIDAGLVYVPGSNKGWRIVINSSDSPTTNWWASSKVLAFGKDFRLVYTIHSDKTYKHTDGKYYAYVQLDVYELGGTSPVLVDSKKAPVNNVPTTKMVEMASIAYQANSPTAGTYFGGFSFDNVYLLSGTNYGTYTAWNNTKTYYVCKGTLTGRPNQVKYTAASTSNYANKVTIDMNYDRQ